MDPAEAVATYGAAWNEPDASRRSELLERVWADGGTYLDPLGRADGRDALAAHIAGFQETMPGHTIDMVSGVDVHDDAFRFAWEMRNADGVALEGMDYGELGPDGRITRIVGFFGPFPDLGA
jgi:hypothetical protein